MKVRDSWNLEARRNILDLLIISIVSLSSVIQEFCHVPSIIFYLIVFFTSVD